MPTEVCVEKMVVLSIPVTQTEGPGRVRSTAATRVGPNGVELTGDAVPAGRFAWLDFELPGSQHPVKALGEVVGVLAVDGTTRVLMRFKHLFPADRVAMASFLNARAAAA